MDRHQYITEAQRQLSNTIHYKPIEESIQIQTQLAVRNIIQTLYNKKYITSKQKNYLYGPENPRPRHFYLLPKIHKDPQTWTIPYEVPPGRPIVSDCNSSTYKISEYIEHFLGPLSTKHPSYIKDTYHFLETIRPMAVPTKSYLFTIDIESLYTNINTTAGLQAVTSTFREHPDINRPDPEIIQLLTICLNNNDFQFNNQNYLQIHGTAMGQRFAPSYANIYMSEWEREALAKCTHKPIIYLRFLDDIFGIWPHNINQFDTFIKTLNDHHPAIKLKHTIDSTQVHFLDTTVFFQPSTGKHTNLLTKVYFKTTDTHALLHKNSYHPKHTFQGIIKSQIIRFYRISSQHTDFNSAVSSLFKSLRNRGYSKRFLRYIKNKTLATLAPARSYTHTAPAQVPDTDAYTTTPDITTYHNPPFPHPKQGLHPNPLPNPYPPPTSPNPASPYPKQGLYPNPTLNPKPNLLLTDPNPNLPAPYPKQGLYPNPTPAPNPNPDNNPTTQSPTHIIPFISTFSRKMTGFHQTIKQNFTHLQLQHPAFRNHKTISAYRRNKNLKDILVHSKFTDHKPQTHPEYSTHYRNRKFITNTYSGASYPTLGTFSLNTSNTVYIITCTICNKHYIGETKHNIHTRLKQHMYTIRQGKLNTPIVQHFQQHPYNKLIITGLEANDGWSTGQRKRAEKGWIFRLDTKAPNGLNDKQNL
uniref:Reverse transcriptase domain-containing protein n=1 Tax=Larimichthys crocea TaxID=215358 RepID=A0A0F8CGT9_LARCR